MSETKSTPGPLTVTRFGGILGGPEHQFVNGRGQLQIGLAMLTEDIGPEERDANARLWAAAPDLLDACKAIASCLGGNSALLDTARKLARAAILKAESRCPPAGQ